MERRAADRRATLAAGAALVLLAGLALGGGRDGPPADGSGSVQGGLGHGRPGGHAYLDGPPPGHTGGFDEPTCARCHFDAPVNPPEASLEVRGFPDGYVPGASYRLTVRLAAPDLGRAGFEAAVRCGGDGASVRQAGRLSAVDDRAEVVPGGGEELQGDSAVLYARHTEAGARTTAPDTAAWRLDWTAPEGPGACGRATLHAAANAANGDDSEFGDRILTLSRLTRAAE